MVDPQIVSGLVNIASSATWDFAKFYAARSREHSCLAKAITLTAVAFPNIPTCSEMLWDWCQSQDFDALLAQFKAGERDVVDGLVVQSFIQATNFFMGDATEDSAQIFLSFFVKNLEQQLLQSPAGLQLVSERMEVLGVQATVESRQHAQALMDQGVAIANKIDNMAAVLDKFRQSSGQTPSADHDQEYKPYYSKFGTLQPSDQ